MNTKHQTTDNPLNLLLDVIKASLKEDLITAIRGEMRAIAAEAKPACTMLSLDATTKRFGIGRINLRKLISIGKLPAMGRICRGGRVGQFINLADAERVLGGAVGAP